MSWSALHNTELAAVTGHAMVLLPSDKNISGVIVIAGGLNEMHYQEDGTSSNVFPSDFAEYIGFPVTVYDPASGLVQSRNLMTETMGRNGHCMWHIGGGTLLVYGGTCDFSQGTPLAFCFSVSDTTRAFPCPSSFNIPPRFCAASCIDKERGVVYVFGGSDPAVDYDFEDFELTFTNTVYTWDMLGGHTGLMRVTGDIPPPNMKSSIAFVRGKLYVYGGYHGSFLGGYVLDVASGVWSSLHNANPGLRSRCSLTAYRWGTTGPWSLLLVGGMGVGNIRLDDTWRYDIHHGKWELLDKGSVAPVSAHAVLLCEGTNKLWMYGGSDHLHGLAGRPMRCAYEMPIPIPSLKDLAIMHLMH